MKKVYLFLIMSVLFVACDYDNVTKKDNKETQITSTKVETKEVDPNLWLGSLITDTPQEGRELAIKMARKSIGAIQSDPEVKKRLRGEYAENAELLILSAQVVAIEFQTVAAANNYWR